MLYLIQNDVGTQLKATITREDDGLPVDMSGDTSAVLKVRKVGSSTTLFTLSAISSDENGRAIFQFADGDLNVDPGSYEAEISVSFPDGRLETVYELLEMYIREEF